MDVSGVLLLDKPTGISSAGAIRKLEKKFKINKIGHGGTLDPFASGLLVILLGDATKIARFLLSGTKTYNAEARIGLATTTGDREGELLSNVALTPPRLETWEKTRPQFLGKIEQIPPKYSAIKKAGRPLYAYARANEAVEIAARPVQIDTLTIQSYDNHTLHFQVTCGGGTYIRTLAEDWARASGSAAYLENLRRIRSGDFSVSEAHKLETLLDPECTSLPPVISIPEALAHLPQIACTATVADKIRVGNQDTLQEFLATQLEGTPFTQTEYVLLLQPRNASEKSLPLALLARPSPRENFKLERVFH